MFLCSIPLYGKVLYGKYTGIFTIPRNFHAFLFAMKFVKNSLKNANLDRNFVFRVSFLKKSATSLNEEFRRSVENLQEFRILQ